MALAEFVDRMAWGFGQMSLGEKAASGFFCFLLVGGFVTLVWASNR